MAGLTSTGFQRKTFEEIVAAMESSLRATVSPTLVFGAESSIGQVVNSSAAEIADVWEATEEAYGGLDVDNATADRFEALCLLTGVRRLGPTAGLCDATVDLDASQTYAPGAMVAHVLDDTDNTWQNRDTVTSTTATTYPAVFVSQATGSAAVAPTGTLTVIASPVAGWNSITNATDATPGTDIESLGALAIRRQDSLGGAGRGTLAAIVADVSALTGMLDVFGIENTQDVSVSGRPPHSIEIVAWSGSVPAVADDDIAQAIFDAKGAVETFGADTGNATDSEGGTKVISFTEATESVTTVAVTIVSAAGYDADAVKAAIKAAFDQDREIGTDIVYNLLTSSVFEVDGVDNWSAFTVNGGTSDVPIAEVVIATLALGGITVT